MKATYRRDSQPSRGEARSGTPSSQRDRSRSGGDDRALTQTMKRSASGGAALRWATLPRPPAAAGATQRAEAPMGPEGTKSGATRAAPPKAAVRAGAGGVGGGSPWIVSA